MSLFRVLVILSGLFVEAFRACAFRVEVRYVEMLKFLRGIGGGGGWIGS